MPLECDMPAMLGNHLNRHILSKAVRDQRNEYSVYILTFCQVCENLPEGTHPDATLITDLLLRVRVGISIPVTPPHPSYQETHKEVVDARRAKEFRWSPGNEAILMRLLREWVDFTSSHPPSATQSPESYIFFKSAFPEPGAQPSLRRLRNKIRKLKDSINHPLPAPAAPVASLPTVLSVADYSTLADQDDSSDDSSDEAPEIPEVNAFPVHSTSPVAE